MRPTQNRTTQNAILLFAVLMIFLLQDTARSLDPNSGSSSRWISMGAIDFSIVFGGFLPVLTHRWKQSPPPQPLSRSDIGIGVAVLLAALMVAGVGILSGIFWLMQFGIAIPLIAMTFAGFGPIPNDGKT